MIINTFRKAFTMIELIFVIIILGIVSSIGAEIISNVYEQYIIQRAQHRASLKTELAATQIANRLSRAIPGTVVRRVGTTGTVEDINSIPNTANLDNYSVLQWVGADVDSFTTMGTTTRNPGWSGFCDVDNPLSLGTTISTPGSNLGLANTVIGSLSGSTTRTLADASIYFPTKFGLTDYNVSNGIGNALTLTTTPTSIVEQYKLAWTSYALEMNAGTLSLHYNFSPIRGAGITGSNTVLLRNVSTFKFRGDGRTIRFKLCAQEEIGEDFNITSCKEKAVF